jgi:hypothetical protein
MKNYFTLKKIDFNIFKYVCRNCYKDLLKKINNSPILDHIENHNGMERLKISDDNSISINDNVENKIKMTNERCISLTGIDLDQLNYLLGCIISMWPYSISQQDALIVYLARLRLGSVLKF